MSLHTALRRVVHHEIVAVRSPSAITTHMSDYLPDAEEFEVVCTFERVQLEQCAYCRDYFQASLHVAQAET
eukprot:5469492-Amphidinium_carterae.1